MDIIKKRLGKQLKYCRKIKNFTQESLAEKIGINWRQLARIEAGESFISSGTLYSICKELNISPRCLFDFEIDETYTDNLLLDVRLNKTFSETEKQTCHKEYETLKKSIESIKDDENKIEYINIALKSLSDTDALNQLKILIKGIELIQK